MIAITTSSTHISLRSVLSDCDNICKPLLLDTLSVSLVIPKLTFTDNTICFLSREISLQNVVTWKLLLGFPVGQFCETTHLRE